MQSDPGVKIRFARDFAPEFSRWLKSQFLPPGQLQTSMSYGAEPMILKDYIPRKMLADEIGVTEKTLIRWELADKGPPVTRLGRDVLYYVPSVERWLRAQERAAKGSTNANAA
jgi:hypothetical protein